MSTAVVGRGVVGCCVQKSCDWTVQQELNLNLNLMLPLGPPVYMVSGREGGPWSEPCGWGDGVWSQSPWVRLPVPHLLAVCARVTLPLGASVSSPVNWTWGWRRPEKIANCIHA